MTRAILDPQDDADPMGPVFGILAGNVRAYEKKQSPPAQDWSIRADHNGGDEVIDALSDYRLPPSIHDLFVNDSHRRFHQRLHRTVRDDETEVGGNRNCDNTEIYASSPSYLITAGGAPATYAIDPYFLGIPIPGSEKQVGVAVTTSFMPTTYLNRRAVYAQDLIQFSSFAEYGYGGIFNYGVAPDFACGHQLRPADWMLPLKDDPQIYVIDGNFTFIDQGSDESSPGRPGFYLAIYQENGFGLLEAFDTWLHRKRMGFAEFQHNVKDRATKLGLSLKNNVVTHYQTWNGNEFDFVIWAGVLRHSVGVGAEILNFKGGDKDPRDSFGDAGNATDKFLSGTVMNSPKDATVEITNYDLGTKITLDMSDLLHPKRISTETNEIEQAGFDNEVWLDFEWKGPNQGDAYQPFNTMTAATAAVAEDGVIKIIPGQSNERTPIGGKRMKLVAPIGGVTIGSA
jgi:hypothetical protein